MAAIARDRTIADVFIVLCVYGLVEAREYVPVVGLKMFWMSALYRQDTACLYTLNALSSLPEFGSLIATRSLGRRTCTTVMCARLAAVRQPMTFHYPAALPHP